ncbi:MAG: pyridoxal phosphate-dependent aminotransferase [Oscillospiraceae bacterium]|jgi:aspartate aminotransferase|nr:pyridoxal phosphate-dependent aminotransferase [Oscillospiraceae bacterium]
MPCTLSRLCRGIAPSLTLAIDARAKEMQAQGLQVIGFGAGEPDFDTPAAIRDAAKDALDRGMTRYTPVAGTLELRKAICDKLARDNGLIYTPNQIIACNGAKHALLNTFLAILDPGDEVLIPSPWWVSYPEMVRMAGGVPVAVPTSDTDGFVATAAHIAPHITPRTKALILNSPNNPNGSVWSRQQLAEIATLAVEKQFYVVSDEIYEKLIYDGYEHVSIASLGPDIYAQTVVINGVSKAYAMTGWRVGYAAGPAPLITAMTSYQSHATSNINAIAQHAAAVALGSDPAAMRDMVAVFDGRRKALVSALNGIPGLRCSMPHGAFYAMLDIRGALGKRCKGREITGSMDFADALLQEAQVAVVPGIAFDAEGYCRLSYALSMQKIEQGAARIRTFMANLA